jgi:sterol desaturase/sphingolipid hydroxylase (fatty acid hydroxylase superfamily)
MTGTRQHAVNTGARSLRFSTVHTLITFLLQNVVPSTSQLVVLVPYILYSMVLMLQRTMTNCTSGTTTTLSSSSSSSSAKQQPYNDDRHHPDWNNQHPSATTTTATSTHHNISFSMMILFAMNTIWLIYFHVSMNLLPNKLTYDDASTTIWYHPWYDSLQNMWWWRHVTAMDMILFTSLVVMAFELLDCVTKLSASTLLLLLLYVGMCVCDDDGCCYWLYMVGSFFRGWLLLSFLLKKECLATQQIPVRGKHLDTLRTIDKYCIAFSKANTAPFTYFYLRFCYYHDTILWDWAWSSWLSVPNTIVPLLCLFLLFDLTYTAFHCTLHLSWIYPYIHKQHHIQKAPSRANVDAVNVHPIEFLGGEYNHLLVLYLYTSIFHGTVHILAAVLFLVLGGLLAGTNHTRYDVLVWLWRTMVIFNTTV